MLHDDLAPQADLDLRVERHAGMVDAPVGASSDHVEFDLQQKQAPVRLVFRNDVLRKERVRNRPGAGRGR